jgi:hypothetical protein
MQLNASMSRKTLVGKSCIIFPAVLSYDISLQNQIVALTYDDYSKDEFHKKL